MSGLPWLALVLALPLAGIALVWLAPAERHARDAALAAALATLAAVAATVAGFDADRGGFQMVVSLPWMPDLGIHYRLGVDGISLLPAASTALLFFAAILGVRPGQPRARLFFSHLLLLEVATLGVLLAIDAVCFLLFWELSVVPIYFLIAGWGIGADRRAVAAQYALLMLAGGVPLLFGLLLPALQLPVPEFDLRVLLSRPLPEDLQGPVLLLLLAGFAVKAPLPPLHAWLPRVAMEGPVAVTALVAGIKLGLYGLIRFAVPLAPTFAQDTYWLLGGLGVVAVLHGSLVAMTQTNLRTLLAYAGIAHVGLALLALATFTLEGLQASLLLLVNFSLATGGGFLAAAFLQARTGSCELQNLGGASRTMPRLAAFFLLCGLAALGLPGTSGFPGEFLALLVAVQTHTGGGLAALAGMVLAGAYLLGLYRRTFYGPVVRPAVAEASDLLPREAAVAVLLGLAILSVGLFPQTLLALTERAATDWVLALRLGR